MDAKTESEIAKVVTAIGQLKAQDKNGNLRDLKPGDSLQDGDIVMAMPNARGELVSHEGQHYFLQPNESITLTSDMAGNDKVGIYDLALTNITIDEILEAINQDGAIDELLEATAAGLTGGANGEGNSFVRLLRIVEELSPDLRLELDNVFSPDPAVFDDGVVLEIEELTPPAQNLPPVAQPDIETTLEDTPVTIAVLGNDNDPDGDPLVVVAVDDQPIAVGEPVTIPEGVVSLNPDGTITFTPNPDFNGPVEFPYTISDGVNTDTEVVSIEVTPVNDGPDAVADNGTTPEDTAITIAVLSNDTDIDGDTLTVTHVAGVPIVVGAPVAIPEGLVALNGDGTLTFTPNPDFNGPVDFPYTITDGTASDTAQVSIDVTPVNDGPIANADVRTVDEDSAGITGNVIAAGAVGDVEDTDVDGDGLTVTNPGTYAGVYGDLILNADGSYSYVPNAAAQGLDDGESEQDVFSYTITDGDETSTASLTINVTGSNDGPIANADVRTVDEDSAGITGNVIAAGAVGDVEDTDVDGDGLTVTNPGTYAGVYGDLILNADGSYSYVPNAAAQGLDDGESEQDVFSYTITDGDETSTASLTINVTGSNDGPIANADVRTVDEDSAGITGNVIAAGAVGDVEDTDVDGDGLTVTNPGTYAGVYGDLILNADGSYSYVPNAAAQGLDDGESEQDVFSYTITDGDETSTASLTINVTGSNDGPIANADVRTVDEDSAGITGNVIAAGAVGDVEDTDVDGDGLTVTNPGTYAGVYGDLILNADGSYSYVPNAAAQGLDDGESEQDVFSYTITDGDETSTASLTINVTGSNDGPIANADVRTVDEDSAGITGNVIAAGAVGDVEDTDVDGDGLTVTNPGTYAGVYGDLILNADGSYSYVPNAAAQGLDDGESEQDVFSYTITDGDETSTASLTINVTGSNDGPIANADVRTVDEDSAGITGNVIAAGAVGDVEDTDVDGDGLTVTNPGTYAGVYGDLILNADGSYSYVPNAAAQGLDDGESEQDVFSYTITDGDETSTASLTINVTGSNDGPIANADVRTVDEDSAGITGNVIAAGAVGDVEDTDVDGDGLTVTNPGTYAGVYGDLILNADGSYSYVPNAAAQGLDDGESEQDVFSYTITDGDETSTASLTINVTGSNDGPIANADVRTVDEDSAGITGNVIAAGAVGDVEDTDVDGDGLTVTNPGTYAGVYGDLILNADGSYSYVPNAAAQGLDDGESEQDVFSYTITDGDETSTASLTINVTGSNDGPIANADVRTVDEDSAGITGNVIAAGAVGDVEDTDVDGDGLTVTNPGTYAGVYGDLILNADGSYSYVPNAAAQGLDDGESEQDVFSYTITDGDETSTASLTINVTGSNDGPIANADVRTVDEDSAGITGNVIAAGAVGDVEDTDVDGDGLTVTNPGTYAGVYGDLILNADGSYSYVPNAAAQGLDDGESEQDVFSYTITDGDETSTASLTINVTGSNDGPIANADVRTVDEDSAGITGNVIAAGAVGDVEDTDVDGDGLTVTNPGTYAGVYGDLILNADGSYSYVPNAAAQGLDDGESEQDVFSYTITDGDETSTASLTINVTGSNDGPIANADVRTVDEDSAGITGNVIAAGAVGDVEDTDVDGDGLTVTNPGTYAGVYGDLILNADGSYSYVPNAAAQGLDDGESEQDVFSYTITDGDETSTASLTINVTGSNDGPIANADVRTVDEDSAGITGNVIAAGAVGDVEDTDVDGDGLTVTNPGTYAGVYGDLILNADGSYSYVPNAAAQGLDDGESEQDVFSYTITDGDETSTASLTINVTGSNDGPIANADVRTVDEDSAGITGNVIAAGAVGDVEDTDVDGDGLTVTNPGTYAGVYGDLILNADGSYSYVPNAAAQGLDDGESEQDVFSYTITDGDETSTASLTINVTGSNDGPIANADVRTVDEDSAGITGNVIAAGAVGDVEDTDVDGDGLTVTNPGTYAGVYGDLILNADGSYSYVPNAAAQGLDDGESEQDVFSYTITDGDETSTASLTINVTGSNDGPIANADVRTVDEDSAGITGNVIAAGAVGDVEDTDVDGDGLTVTNPGTYAGVYGDLILNADGSYSYVPNAAAQGLDDGESEQDVFSYTITDGDETSTASLTINVTGSNDGPIANADVRTVDEDSAGITGNVIAAGAVGDVEDTDVDGDGLTVTNPGTYAGVYGDLILNADGSYSYVPNAAAQGLDDGESEQDVFSYTITDGDETSTASLTINVTGSNDGPSVSNANGNVSEEGLANSIKDTDGTVDTTDSAVTTGTMVINDVDGDAITSVVLTAPTDLLTSGGNTVTWSGQGTDTLVGMAGGKLVATLSINTAGAYEFILSAPLDHPDDTQEDAMTLAFGVTASDGTDTGQGTLSLTVEDDAPTLLPKSHEINLVDNNVLIVLDVSGSMNTSDGIGGLTRLQTAIQSINTLLDGYDQFGDVAVRIVTFSSNANAVGTQWTDIAEAKAQLATLSANGYTNYDAALDTAETAFGSVGALTGGQNVSYFFSDGNPNRPSGSAGINGTEEANWEDFLEANQVASFAIGLGDNVDQTRLDPIAYNGQTMQEADAIVVNDYADLNEVLIGTLPDMPMGNLLYGSLLSGVGADGGHVDFITVNGITYTYDSAGSGSVTVSGGPSSGVFNVLAQTLTIVTGIGGELEINLATGMYNYSAPIDAMSGQEELFAYGVIDNDGDTGESTLSIEVDSYNVINGTSSADHLMGTSDNDLISAQGGNDVIQGAGGNDRLLGGAGNDTLFGNEGNDQLLGGLGNDLLAGGIGSDAFVWELGDQGAPGAPAVDQVTDFLAVDVLAGGDVLDLRDLLQGEDAGNLTDYLHFEADGADTVLQISSDGDFSGGYSSAYVDQTIVLHDMDLTSAGTMLDAQIINDLMQKGNLRVDI